MERRRGTLRRSGCALLLVAFFFGCGPQPSVNDNRTVDAEHYAALRDTMRRAAQKRDTLFCDSVLMLFEKEVVVLEHPAMVAHAYGSSAIARRTPTPALVARMDSTVERTGSTYIANWRDFMRGRIAMKTGPADSAMMLFTELHTRFRAHNDTVGTCMAAKQIGIMYKERLAQSDLAIPYLQEYFEHAGDVNEKYNAAVQLCGAYLLNDQLDSSAAYLAYLDAHLPELEANAPGYPADKGERRDLVKFLLEAERAKQGDIGAMDSLKVWAGPMLAFYEATYKQLKWNPVHMRVAYAQALTRHGDTQGALAVLKAGVAIAEDCPACVRSNVELYGLLAHAASGNGDEHAELIALRARDRWKALYDDAAINTEVEKARLKVHEAHVKDSVAYEIRTAQQAAQVEVDRTRMHRFGLIVLLGLVLVVAALLVNRYRLKRRLQVERLRVRLSRDLHDDIGGTLSSISILSNVVKKRAEASGDMDNAASMEKISERSLRLMRDMSDIVWSVDPGKDSMTDLIGRMREFGSAVLEPKGIAFHFNAPAKVVERELSVDVKKNLYLIFKEAVNNAAKHGGAQSVFVDIALNGRSLHVQVDDDGQGMRLEATAPNGLGGNGLRNMAARAEEIGAYFSTGSSERGGVCVVLELALG